MAPRYEQQGKSGEHQVQPCNEHSLRIESLEQSRVAHSERIQRSETQLSDGRVQFAELRKDLQAATQAIEHLATQVQTALANAGPRWGEEIGKAFIFWAVPIGGTALVWLINASKAIHP